MTLNRRLLMGIAPMLLIFTGVGIYAIFLFLKLGGAIDVILRENYQSVEAAQNMRETGASMDTGLLFALQGEETQGRDLFQKSLPIFEKYSDLEAHNITLPGEGDMENQIVQLHGQYVKLATDFFNLPAESPARRDLYFQKLSPLSGQINAVAGKILQINQDNMVRANGVALEQSHVASQYMGEALIVGLIVAMWVTYRLSLHLVQPIKNLTESAQQLGEGNLDQHVTVRSQDEVGRLAEAFNSMAAKLRAYRQSTTEKILQAQQTTESALRAFPDPILVFSPLLVIQLQNEAAEKLLKQVGGLDSLGSISAKITESFEGAPDFQPTSFDKAISLHVNGVEKFYLPKVLAMRNEAGTPLGVVVALQDVTRFRVADDLKTNLIATVSHELKTPLTSMQMAVYLLLEEKIGPLNPKQTELLLAARSNSDRLLDMIEGLLDLARFEDGAGLVEKKRIPGQQLLDEIVNREKELVTSRGLELKVNSEPKLPLVEVNLPRISQVFANFISNAVKYSLAGGVITLSAKNMSGDKVRFAVCDNGAGIPKHLQRRIFEKFFRVSESGEQGVGLGLSIAKEIVLAHGGTIGVESHEGQGSEFFFNLPACT